MKTPSVEKVLFKANPCGQIVVNPPYPCWDETDFTIVLDALKVSWTSLNLLAAVAYDAAVKQGDLLHPEGYSERVDLAAFTRKLDQAVPANSFAKKFFANPHFVYLLFVRFAGFTDESNEWLAQHHIRAA